MHITHCILNTTHFTYHTTHCKIPIAYCTVHSAQCTVYTTGQGAFGSVHVGQARVCGYLGREEEEEEERLVAVKTMAGGAGQGERDDFVKEVNISS